MTEPLLQVNDLVKRFAKARGEEEEHLEKVQAWYRQATMELMQET